MDDNIVKLGQAAQMVIEKMGPASKIAFGFNRESIAFVEKYIEAQRQRATPGSEPPKGLLNSLGAFVGECVVRNGKGRWQYAPDVKAYGVVFADKTKTMVYPLEQIRQLFMHGVTAHGGLLSMYDQALAVPIQPINTQLSDVVMLIDFDPPDIYPAISDLELEPVEDFGRGTPSKISALIPDMPTDEKMSRLLNEVRALLNSHRPSLNGTRLNLLKGKDPEWMTPEDGLSIIANAQGKLLTKGHVVWASLVMANNSLFKPGPNDSPALLVFSGDPYFDARPHELRAIASKIYDLKNTKPENEQARKVAEMVSDDMDRRMNWRLPDLLTVKDVRWSAFMVFRKHIPEGQLHGSRFPVLIHPETDACMIVPFEFWPQELVSLWVQGKL